MPLIVDLDQLTIRASIRDLAQTQRDLSRGFGLLGRARAELGQRVHQLVRKEREQDEAGYCPEVEVWLELSVDGFSVKLRGRADGLIESPDGMVVEEVKSVLLGGAEIARVRSDTYPEFNFQVRLYAMALKDQHPKEALRTRLLLVSLLDGSRRLLQIDPQLQATQTRLTEILREAIEKAKRDRERAVELARIADRLRLPHPQARPHQAELIQAMQASLAGGRPALVMAPTGIGKTVAALLAGLGHCLRVPTRLVYATAKTTQRRLVEATFEEICAGANLPPGTLRSLTLRAKERMCPPGHLLCHPELCPLLKDFQSRLASSQALSQLLAGGSVILPDAVYASGEAHGLCPFNLSHTLIPEVDLLVGDFNHLYDPGVALEELFEGPGSAPVVIVDEAHNLFDRARGYFSPFVSRAELAELASELSAGTYLAEGDRSDQLDFDGMIAIDGPQLFSGISKLICDAQQSATSSQRAAEAEGNQAIDDCRALFEAPGEWEELGRRANELMVPFLLYNRTHGLFRPDDPLLALLTRLIRLRDSMGSGGPETLAYTAGSGAPQGAGFGVLCMNPAPKLEVRHRKASGTIAMSATLTPLSYYADVLGFTPLEPEQLSCPSPFPRENLIVRTCTQVSTTYRERDQHIDSIAQIIRQTVSAREGRYVAFFPSFQFLSRVQQRLGLPATQLHMQIPGLKGPGRQRLLDRFRTSRGPSLLLAVMGGIYAEGIDLPGAELIGAVVVGPGLPQVGFERAAMQHYFQQTSEAGFAYAMLYPGMQRVIQSAGRVIRSAEDRGVIVLVGKRFAQPELAACLPEHWYRFDSRELVSQDLTQDLSEFWRAD